MYAKFLIEKTTVLILYYQHISQTIIMNGLVIPKVSKIFYFLTFYVNNTFDDLKNKFFPATEIVLLYNINKLFKRRRFV